MITRFLGKVFSGRIFNKHQPRIIPLSVHGIARDRAQCDSRLGVNDPADENEIRFPAAREKICNRQ